MLEDVEKFLFYVRIFEVKICDLKDYTFVSINKHYDEENTAVALPDEIVMNKIYLMRGQKVKLDSDLAELYQVETRVLNQAVSRNEYRFPSDFMFPLTVPKWENLKSQSVTSS